MEHDPPPTDYAAILADMEAKKAALETAIGGLRAALSAGALGAVTGDFIQAKDSASLAISPGIPPGSIALPRGALLGKSGTEAIKLYLSSVRTKQTNKEIGDALKQGGVESTGKSFDAFVNSSLFRLKNSGELLRFDDGWGLAEWYPESFRAKIADKSAVNGKHKTKRVHPAVARARRDAKRQPKSKSSEPNEGLQQRIEKTIVFLGGAVSSQGIAESLDANLGAVNLSLGKMAAKGKVEKGADGNYRLKTPATAKAS